MRSSFSSAATAFKGFAGWISGRRDGDLTDDGAPNVFSACGAPERPHDAPAEFSGHKERWSPGLSVDNFS
jgi:hypothetical protein